MYNRLINSPMSVVGHDDLHVLSRHPGRACTPSGNEWVSLHRNFDPAEVDSGDADRQRHQRDLPMRNQFRAWAQYMTLTM